MSRRTASGDAFLSKTLWTVARMSDLNFSKCRCSLSKTLGNAKKRLRAFWLAGFVPEGDTDRLIGQDVCWGETR